MNVREWENSIGIFELFDSENIYFGMYHDKSVRFWVRARSRARTVRVRNILMPNMNFLTPQTPKLTFQLQNSSWEVILVFIFNARMSSSMNTIFMPFTFKNPFSPKSATMRSKFLSIPVHSWLSYYVKLILQLTNIDNINFFNWIQFIKWFFNHKYWYT